jgi:hypothetical protein
MQRIEVWPPPSWGLGGSGDRRGPGAAIRGAPILQTNNRAAGSKVREVRQFGPPPRSAIYSAPRHGCGSGAKDGLHLVPGRKR